MLVTNRQLKFYDRPRNSLAKRHYLKQYYTLNNIENYKLFSTLSDIDGYRGSNADNIFDKQFYKNNDSYYWGDRTNRWLRQCTIIENGDVIAPYSFKQTHLYKDSVKYQETFPLCNYSLSYNSCTDNMLMQTIQSPYKRYFVKASLLVLSGGGFIGVQPLEELDYHKRTKRINHNKQDLEIACVAVFKEEYKEYVELCYMFDEPIDPIALEFWIDSRFNLKKKSLFTPIKSFVNKKLIPVINDMEIPIVYKDDLTSIIFKQPYQVKAKSISEYNKFFNNLIS